MISPVLMPPVATPRPAAAAAPPAPAPAADTFTPSAPAGPSLRELLTPSAPVLKTAQMADSYGRVTHLALMLSNYVHGEAREQVLGAYKTLFTQMEPDTKFTIICESDRDQADVEQAIRDCQAPNPERIEFFKPDVGSLTVWARDMMVGLYTPDDPSHTALLHQTTLHSWHDNDAKVPELLTQHNPTILLDTEPHLVTDGGDVMSNTKESFVGMYSIAATEEQIGKRIQADPRMKETLIDFYQSHFGKRVVEQKGPIEHPYHLVPHDNHGKHGPDFKLVANPNFHAVDPGPGMVTLQQATEDLAVALFAEHFGKPVQPMGKDDPTTVHKEEPATDHMDMGMTPIDDNTFLVGDPSLARKIIDEMTDEERAAAGPMLARFDSRNRDSQEDFDAYARTLEAKGYRVKRVPHLEPSNAPNGAYLSYNNCLMERFEKDGQEIRRVFLPIYGIPKLDNAAMDIWRSEGFEVHPMRLEALSEEWGALRCISNWLARSPRG